MNLLYTSGSSGRPKGAVYREHIIYGTIMVCAFCFSEFFANLSFYLGCEGLGFGRLWFVRCALLLCLVARDQP